MIALLFFEVLVILCLIAAITVWQRPGVRPDAGAVVSRRVAPLLDAERDLAASLGVPFAVWAAIRLTLFALALLVGLTSGVVVIAVVLLLLGTLGVPWLVEDVASARRSRAYRSLVATVRDLANALQRMGNLDAVLREVAQHPRPDCASC